jgi:outer membrane protein, heavy metal efflux system
VLNGSASPAARVTRWAGAVLAAVGLSCAALRAEGPAGLPAAAAAPPVEELVKLAIDRAPSIAARRARLAAAQAVLPVADVHADPFVEFEFRNGGFPGWTLGSDPMTMMGGSIRQPLVSKGRKEARRAEASAEVDLRHAETDKTACDLTLAVRTVYARVYAIDRERAILRDAEEMAKLLAETASLRYASGASDQAAVLRAQIERSRLAERETDLDGERSAAVATLNRLLDQPAGTPFGQVESLPEPTALPAPPADLPNLAAEVAPEVAVRKADVAAATRRVETARQDLKPVYTVGGAFYWQGNTDFVASVTLGIEWRLHKSRRQEPLIAAAQQELEASRYDMKDEAAGMRADAARLVEEARRADEQIQRYRSGLLPQSSAAFDAARASYLSGRGDFASALDEFRRWTEVRVELARREAGRFATWGELDVLVNPAAHDIWEHSHGQPAEKPKEPRS